MKNNKILINTILDIVLFVMMISIFTVKGELHETIAYTLGILMTFHVALHWKHFSSMYHQLIPESKYQKLAAILIGALVVGILATPLYLPNNDRGDDYGRPVKSDLYR